MPKPTPTGRPCPQCGAVDPPRYSRGACAPCKAALSVAWAKANPEKVAASNSRWAKANPEKRAINRAARYKVNPEPVKARAAAWRKANPAQHAADNLAWYWANREKVAARAAARYKANPESTKARAIARYKADPGPVKARAAAWKKANPDKVSLSVKRRRARLTGVLCEPYLDVDIFERDGWLCHLCDGFVVPGLSRMDPMGATIDHVIPISKGGDDVPANVRVAHLRCNTARGNRSVEWARARLIVVQPVLAKGTSDG